MKYNKEYSFIDTVISDFDKYITYVANFVEKQRSFGFKMENLETHVNITLYYQY